MSESPRLCSVPECGRPARALGYCQAHYKQLRAKGSVRPFAPKRSPRRHTVKINAVSVSVDCAAKLRRCAAKRECTLNEVITDLLEAWNQRRMENRPLRGDP